MATKLINTNGVLTLERDGVLLKCQYTGNPCSNSCSGFEFHEAYYGFVNVVKLRCFKEDIIHEITT